MKSDKPIKTSLLDTDYYEYTMGQAIHDNFPKETARLKFKCRSGEKLSHIVGEVRENIEHLCTLKHTPGELDFLKNRKEFSSSYLEYLRLFQFNKDFIDIQAKGNELSIETHGPLANTSPFEVHSLSIVNEVFTRNMYPDFDYTEAIKRLHDKTKAADDFFRHTAQFTLADFGTRRRFNFEWQRKVDTYMAENLSRGCFVGTSNVLFAKELDIKPIGTHAHKYFQIGQATTRISESVKHMLQIWADTFRGSLGIALSDIVGFDAFLENFDLYFAKLFDGCRHDSGDPFIWCNKLIEHYEKLGIDPTTKIAVFSDGLDFPLMFKLIETFRGRIKLSFGIGTNITNDMGEFCKALQIVMKMIECNGFPVAKIPDSPGKGMNEDPEFMRTLRNAFNLPLEELDLVGV
jgi:nicotinate phosphoribosyltransferase